MECLNRSESIKWQIVYVAMSDRFPTGWELPIEIPRVVGFLVAFKMQHNLIQLATNWLA